MVFNYDGAWVGKQQLVVSMLQYLIMLKFDDVWINTCYGWFILSYVFSITSNMGYFYAFKALSMLIPSSFCLISVKNFHVSCIFDYKIINFDFSCICNWFYGYVTNMYYIRCSFMRLYVIFNLLDIFDKLLTALGQDLLIHCIG